MIDHVVTEVGDGVQTIRFDRIEARNALTAAMCEATADAMSLAESNSRIRAILVTGEPGIFTAGHDPAELAAFAERGGTSESVLRFLKTIATVDKPVVAAVDGAAGGVGTALLFHCDYVIASEWSVFSASFAEMGLAPDAAASLLAPRLLGYHRAFGLMVMGDQFDAQQAMQAGLVNRVVAAGEVETAGPEAARTLAAMPQEAIRIARRLMRGDRREVVARIDQEAAALTELLRSPAARDALNAFIETRGRSGS
jgi:enoyl-CoA hydratase/carnithine racemase